MKKEIRTVVYDDELRMEINRVRAYREPRSKLTEEEFAGLVFLPAENME